MYNNHLGDLYKVTGQYVISALQRRSPQKKRRGRRKKTELDDDLLLDGPEDAGYDMDELDNDGEE